LGWTVKVGDVTKLDAASLKGLSGVFVQYPATDGTIVDYEQLAKATHDAGALVVACADLLSLTMLKPPGEFGADIVVGSAQRFGVPMGYGGPHAGFFACKDEYKRLMPGRIIGVSKDSRGKRAFRMALQTREQHIRREKATSNICTAQALLANTASMYAVYHGPKGLRAIAEQVHAKAVVLAEALKGLGLNTGSHLFFDTVRVELSGKSSADVIATAEKHGINVRALNNNVVTIALDETTTKKDLETLVTIFSEVTGKKSSVSLDEIAAKANVDLPAKFARTSEYLTHPVFNSHHSEHEMLRYMYKLQLKDIGLQYSMIPLGFVFFFSFLLSERCFIYP
jgi:glycine dehydrogenase